MSQHETEAKHDEPVAFGLLAEYRSPAALVGAARRVREAGYQKWDAHSPFPVHGIDGAMGVRMTRLPWLVLVGGLVGLLSALVFQWWANAVDYPLVISAKPLFSLPANIPVIFELTILLAGITAFLGVLVFNLLPSHHHPLFTSERFRRATSDGFFISVEAGDERFDATETRALLESAGATHVEAVVGPRPSEHALPRGVTYGIAVVVVASLIPLALVARARVTTSGQPPVDLIDDMDAQPRYGAQAASAFFANGRAYREPMPGTVARDDTSDDTHLWHGKIGDTFATTLPPGLVASEALMRRGQERFDIYCAPCHGRAGAGDGPVARRAEQLQEGTWVQPTSIDADHVRAQPLGQLVNTIANGIRNMPAYGPQLSGEDRWAIAIYVEALQRSQSTSIDDVPRELRPELK